MAPTEAKMKRRLEQIDESIARYLSQLFGSGPNSGHFRQGGRTRIDPQP
jgi:hypothetical protein